MLTSITAISIEMIFVFNMIRHSDFTLCLEILSSPFEVLTKKEQKSKVKWKIYSQKHGVLWAHKYIATSQYLLVKQGKRGYYRWYDDGGGDIYLQRITTKKSQNYYPYG